jgi:hypothetical protein
LDEGHVVQGVVIALLYRLIGDEVGGSQPGYTLAIPVSTCFNRLGQAVLRGSGRGVHTRTNSAGST